MTAYYDPNDPALSKLTPKFMKALLKWAGDGAVKLTGFYDSAYAYGGCETCGPEITQTVDVYYERKDGTKGSKTHSGSFLSMLEYLV